jgi:hypothetical protein
MSKELKKFEDRHKKLASGIKQYTRKNADALKKQVYSNYLSAKDHGEGLVTEAIADARDNGITGNKFADFAKDSGFKDALKTFNKAVDAVEKPLKELETFTANALQLADSLAVLHGDIVKDLKKRKDKSESKADIENLQAAIEKEHQEVTAAAKVLDSIPKPQREYGANFQKVVDKLVKEAPEAAAAKRDAVVLPQMLVDRNRAKGKNGAVKAYRDIKALCDEALVKSETSIKDAQSLVREAATILKKLKSTNDDFDKALKHVAKSSTFKTSKDKKKIEDDVATIAKAYEQAERQVRGIATTLKKAG